MFTKCVPVCMYYGTWNKCTLTCQSLWFDQGRKKPLRKFQILVIPSSSSAYRPYHTISGFFNKLRPACNEFDYNKYPAMMSRLLCIKIIDCNVKKFGYNEHPLITSSSFATYYSLLAEPGVIYT